MSSVILCKTIKKVHVLANMRLVIKQGHAEPAAVLNYVFSSTQSK